MHFAHAEAFEKALRGTLSLGNVAFSGQNRMAQGDAFLRLFNADGLLAVGDTLYQWRNEKLYMRHNQDSNWQMLKTDLALVSSSNGLPICAGSRTEHGKSMVAQNNSLVGDNLQNLKDFIALHQSDFDMLKNFARTYQAGLVASLTDPSSTDEEIQNAKMILALLDYDAQLQNLNKQHHQLLENANYVQYVNALVENKHSVLLQDLSLSVQQSRWFFSLPVNVNSGNTTTNVTNNNQGSIGGSVNITGNNNTVLTNPSHVNIGFSAQDMAMLVDKINASNALLAQTLTNVVDKNQQTVQAFTNTLQTVSMGLIGLMESLIGTSHFSPTTTNPVKEFIQGGSNSAFIQTVVQKAGIIGTDQEKLTRILGDAIQAMQLENAMEYSFYSDFKPIANKAGYNFYYFYLANKNFDAYQAKYQVTFQPYLLRVAEDFSKYQTLSASSVDFLKPDLQVVYKNPLGQSLTLAENQKIRTPNQNGYNNIQFEIHQKGCIQNLSMFTEIAASKIFSARVGNYHYQESIVK